MSFRLSDEDGLNAGWRNWGRLMLALVPAALGGAALMWISVAFGWIELSRVRRMEDRTMQSVGISVMPTATIRLTTNDGSCLKAEESYLDGSRLQFYARNTCKHPLNSPFYIYRLKAGDGTVIGGERYFFDGDNVIEAQERREQSVRTTNDKRLESVELWLVDGRQP